MPPANRDPRLRIFSAIPSEVLDRPFILSSLQDFEASLFLIFGCRWPAAHVLLWSACEKMIKASLSTEIPGSLTPSSAEALQDMTAVEILNHYRKANTRISPSLFAAAQNLRKLRNDVTHKGASPQDDLECLEAFFCGGASFYEAALQYSTGKTIQEHLPEESRWFWRVYSSTRKAIFAASGRNRDRNQVWASLFFFVNAIDKVERTRMVLQNTNPHRGYLHWHEGFEEDAQDAMWKSKSSRESEIEDFFQNQVWDYRCSDGRRLDLRERNSENASPRFKLKCPLCGAWDGIIAFSCSKEPHSKRMVFRSLEAYCCMNASCVAGGEICESSGLVSAVFEGELTLEDTEILASEWGYGSTPTAP